MQYPPSSFFLLPSSSSSSSSSPEKRKKKKMKREREREREREMQAFSAAIFSLGFSTTKRTEKEQEAARLGVPFHSSYCTRS
jgi:hypothetical protein